MSAAAGFLPRPAKVGLGEAEQGRKGGDVRKIRSQVKCLSSVKGDTRAHSHFLLGAAYR